MSATRIASEDAPVEIANKKYVMQFASKHVLKDTANCDYEL